MPASLVSPIAVPDSVRLPAAWATPDFQDAYQVVLPAPLARQSAAEVAYALLGQAPPWVHGLMRLRDALVRRLHLRTFPPRPRSTDWRGLQPGEQFGPFRVLQVAPATVLLGQDDRHLDFRVVVRVQAGAAIVSTSVRLHNRLGRLYFALVRPLHRLIVPAMLRYGRHRSA